MVDLRKQPSAGTDPQVGNIGPLESKLADAISTVFEEHELQMGPQANAGATWPQEVDRAAADLEDGLLDGGALMELLRLIDSISQKLHDGEYHHAQSGMRAGPTGAGPFYD